MTSHSQLEHRNKDISLRKLEKPLCAFNSSSYKQSASIGDSLSLPLVKQGFIPWKVVYWSRHIECNEKGWVNENTPLYVPRAIFSQQLRAIVCLSQSYSELSARKLADDSIGQKTILKQRGEPAKQKGIILKTRQYKLLLSDSQTIHFWKCYILYTGYATTAPTSSVREHLQLFWEPSFPCFIDLHPSL